MDDPEKLERIIRILEEVRANQQMQLERQAESLSIQKEQFQIFLKQNIKTAELQERAERVQERSAQLVNKIRKFVPFLLAAVVALIAYVTWLLWRFVR